ncbi:outer membrane protein assembly factor BamB family protein [Natronococcus amylolyticus]|uniref:outer membrane protein assembly factor BamB family protein n=1 Tax=Natronococcus amylolyticus TaxID=44470 RepID=UPI000677DB63|nr:PQQ-binding-like beta-propeller repeat protein [Natronococcus amylolyticus]
MTTWRRRSVLTTGAVFAAGGVLSSAVSADGEDDDEQLPDSDIDPNPETDAMWPSNDGDAGHARYAADAPEFDGEALKAAWTVERADGKPAVADGVVHLQTLDGIAAFDAADGSTIWEIDGDDDYDWIRSANGIETSDPAVLGDTVYFRSLEPKADEYGDRVYEPNVVVALDAADGSVRWAEDLDEVGTLTVAYGTVFTLSGDTASEDTDATLYALDADDGSVRWERESITIGAEDDEEYELFGETAAANGVVYTAARSESAEIVVALNPDSGDVIWHTEDDLDDTRGAGQIRATAGGVALDASGSDARYLYDPVTGDKRETVTARRTDLVLGEEIYIAGDGDNELNVRSHDDENGGWDLEVDENVTDAAVIGGDTVYVYFATSDSSEWDGYSGELVAFEKDDGSERWTVSTDDRSVGNVVAIDDETLYVEDGNALVALREDLNEGDTERDDETPEEDEDESVDEDEDGDRDPESDDEDADDEGGETDDEYEGEEDGDDESDDVDDGDQEESSDDGDDDPDDTEGDGEPDDDDGDRDDTDGDGDDSRSDIDDGSDGDTDDTGTGDDPDDTTEDTDAETDDDADSVPGFTTGAGLVGGAVGLEWLRRKAGTNDTVDEPTEAAEDRAE